MSNYTEKFEKMRIAGKLAAQTLDMLTENIKEGISTAHIDKLGYEFIREIMVDTLPHFTIVVLLNLYVHLLIMLCVMVCPRRIEFWLKEMRLM